MSNTLWAETVRPYDLQLSRFFSLWPDKSYQNGSALCAVDANNLSDPQMCDAFVRPTSAAPLCCEAGRGWTAPQHTAVAALAPHQQLPSFSDWSFPCTPLSASTSFYSATVGSVCLQAAVTHCSNTWQMGQGSKNDLEQEEFRFDMFDFAWALFSF